MNDEQLKATSSFRLLTQKPKLVIVNLADDDSPERFAGRGLSPFAESAEQKGTVPLSQAPASNTPPLVAIPLGLEVELARMTPEDRAEFEREMGVGHGDRDPRPSRARIRPDLRDRKSTRLNSSHANISYAVFCLKEK